jgi:hypothetical protein
MSSLSLSTGIALSAARTHRNQQLPNNRQQHYFAHNNKGRGHGRGRGQGHYFSDNRCLAPHQPNNQPPSASNTTISSPLQFFFKLPIL